MLSLSALETEGNLMITFNINIAQTQALVRLPTIDNNNIAIAETVIRNTVNDLFAAFKTPSIKNRTRLKQFSTIHNFFVSITLTDCDNLKKMSQLSTVNNIDNDTQHFIAEINEVLNEGDKDPATKEDENNVYVATYIEKFINKLKDLKDKYVSYKNTVINSDILKYLHNDGQPLINITKDNMSAFETTEQSLAEDKIVHDEFGKADGRRLYHGIRTSIKRYPFMASIHFFKKFQCAGSIIKNDLVLTSASCLQIAWNNRFYRENPAFLSIRVGCDYYDLCGESIAILEIYFHPQYDPKILKHNLAIMRLTRTINFRHGHVKKIDFDKNPWELPVNSRITVIGWGAKDENNLIVDVYKNKLSHAELDYFPLEDCQDYYSKNFVSHYNFCAEFYTKGGGACSHDAGGPALYNSILMGVISFGSPICGATNVPTVFTKLGFYADWIEDIVEKNHFFSYIRTTETPLKPENQLTTTQKLKILPLGDTTTRSSDSNILRIPQEQAFQDFVSTMFESEEVKAYVNTKDTNTKNNLSKEQSSGSNVEQITVTTEKVQKYTYNNGEIKHTTQEQMSTDESKRISGEATDLLEDSNVKYEIEGISIESITKLPERVAIENISTEDKISESNFTTMLKAEKIENTKNESNVSKDKNLGPVSGLIFNNTVIKHNTRDTNEPRLTFERVIDSSESTDTKEKAEEMSIETITESNRKDIISTNASNDDKTLEENIRSFLEHLDLDEFLISQTTLSTVSKTTTKQEKEINNTLDRDKVISNPKSFLNIFFSDEDDSDESERRGLSII